MLIKLEFREVMMNNGGDKYVGNERKLVRRNYLGYTDSAFVNGMGHYLPISQRKVDYLTLESEGM